MINELCLILWSINLVFAMVQTILGNSVSPILCVLPTIVCIIHYIKAIREE